jgi:polar amino acid transport system substrate-binding protein
MRRHITALAALAVAATLALTGCSKAGSTTAYTITEGKLTACSDVPYPPFEDFDETSALGFTGFDIEIGLEIAKRLDLELVVKDVDFDALQSGTVLVAGQCDLGTSALTITEERKANLDFSDPYYDSLQSLLVPKDSSIKTLDDLADKTIGLQAGTTGLIFAQENAPESASLKEYPSDGELWPALQAKQIDAILQDLPVNYLHSQDDDEYVVVERYETDEQYGFAFAKGEKTELLDDVNAQLKAMRDDGTYDALYAKYFGES